MKYPYLNYLYKFRMYQNPEFMCVFVLAADFHVLLYYTIYNIQYIKI